jgi:general secretion pathway protein G
MARHIRSGRGSRGFTLIELMIVMAIIGIIVGMAVPLYQKSIIRSKESVLKQNLFTIRTVIDEYTYDKQKAPQSLQDLVQQGYLRAIPVDPMTGSDSTWQIVMEDAMNSTSQSEPGIYDVKSGSDARSMEGTAYNEW